MGCAVRDHFLANVDLAEGSVVGFYWPVGDEADVRPLARALAARGHRLALPCVPAEGRELTFRAYAFDDPLTERRGLYEPSVTAAQVFPTVFLLPLIGFDRLGGRLGQGGGYYDATLAAARTRGGVYACGIAFAAQEVDAIPCEAHDQRMDAVVCETGFIDPYA